MRRSPYYPADSSHFETPPVSPVFLGQTRDGRCIMLLRHGLIRGRAQNFCSNLFQRQESVVLRKLYTQRLRRVDPGELDHVFVWTLHIWEGGDGPGRKRSDILRRHGE